MQKREYEFDWRFIGDMERGRPNLGNMTRVEVYRLFQYTLRDILERDYGTPEADRLLREAGVLAGRAFAERFIGPCTDFGAFVAKVKDALEALRIGILRIEKADVTRLDFILTVAEDLDCSGLPDVGHVVCAYDEGFVAGALKEAEANLRHLTWQMERVAEGDYSQSLSFMGDFSVAFNRMSREMRDKVHELTRLFERYKLFTHEDVLTGLLNRKTFFEVAVGELRRARETRSPLCFLMADVDEFRKVNDRYGHASGDSVLQLFACRLREALRPDDLCCRFGGDEFVVFMPHTGRAEGLEVAERIRQGCAQAPIPGAMTELSVTASFGLAAFREEAFDGDFDPVVLLEKAVQHSERLLRRAKDEGRNCVRA